MKTTDSIHTATSFKTVLNTRTAGAVHFNYNDCKPNEIRRCVVSQEHDAYIGWVQSSSASDLSLVTKRCIQAKPHKPVSRNSINACVTYFDDTCSVDSGWEMISG